MDVRIDVLYFGVLKDVTGRDRECLEIDEASTVEDAVRLLKARTSNGHDAVWSSLAVAVNREYAALSVVLKDGDELALLPPVSGGVREDRSDGNAATGDDR